jgi:hypothetical protein
MSIPYIEKLRESNYLTGSYTHGTYGAYHGIMDGICKLSNFFYELNKSSGITCYEEHSGNVERKFGIKTESLHLSVFCSAQAYPAFSLHARVYKDSKPEHYYVSGIVTEHILETSDVDALISYLYFLIGSVDPDRGKWIRIQ